MTFFLNLSTLLALRVEAWQVMIGVLSLVLKQNVTDLIDNAFFVVDINVIIWKAISEGGSPSNVLESVQPTCSDKLKFVLFLKNVSQHFSTKRQIRKY